MDVNMKPNHKKQLNKPKLISVRSSLPRSIKYRYSRLSAEPALEKHIFSM